MNQGQKTSVASLIILTFANRDQILIATTISGVESAHVCTIKRVHRKDDHIDTVAFKKYCMYPLKTDLSFVTYGVPKPNFTYWGSFEKC